MTRATRTGRIGLAQALFVLVAVVAAGIGFADHLPDTLRDVGRIGLGRAALATLLVAAGLFATARMWRANLIALGHRLPAGAAYRAFFPAQVGKYLPGAVWPYLAQVRLTGRHGVPPAATLTAGAMFLAVHVCTGIAVGLVLLAATGVAGQVWGWVLLLPPAAMLLHPKVITWVVRRAGRSATVSLGWRDLARPIAWMLPAWLGYGLAAFLLLTAYSPTADPLRVAGTATGAFALAWVVGLVTVIAPAGIGAREAMLAVLLTPLVGAVPATAVALLLRLCHLIADIGLAAWFGLGCTGRRGSGMMDGERGAA